MIAAPVLSIVLASAGKTGNIGMTSESFAGLLGGIVAIIALVAAVYYGPIGQFGKPARPPAAAQAPAAPAALDRICHAAGMTSNGRRLVSRFRSSLHCAAPSFANFGIEGH